MIVKRLLNGHRSIGNAIALRVIGRFGHIHNAHVGGKNDVLGSRYWRA